MCSSFLPALLLAAIPAASAQGTKLWTQSRFEEFEKGTPQGVTITSDGKLRSGPVATELLTTPSSFVWSVAAGKAGVAYVATGSPATVLRVSMDAKPDAKTQTLFEAKALAVQVLRMGPDGMLYAATLPDGKVYRIKPDAAKSVDESSAEVVFDLSKFDGTAPDTAKSDAKSGDSGDGKKAEGKSRYIWDMTFDPAGKLYIATGGPGAIYKLDTAQKSPKPEVFFKSDEQHIRVLAWDKAGNLLAGSDGSGLVYRIDTKGKAYVLFSAPRREITALAVGSDGTIYAADVGDKAKNPLPQLPVQAGASGITISFVQPGSVQVANASATLPDGTEIYALKPDQAPKKLWSGKDDIVYQLAAGMDGFGTDGLTALTGNRGRILRINTADGSFSDVAHLDAQQVVSAVSGADGTWLVGTANTGKLYRLSGGSGAAKAEERAYASDVLDAGAMTRWGRIEVDPGSRGYRLFTRSGNVEQPVRSAQDWGWSDWQAATNDKIASPPGRYLQWKVELASDGVVAGVGVNYLPINAAPAVDEIVVVPGARFTAQPAQQGQATVQIAFPSASATPSFDASANAASQPIQAQKDKAAVTARWAAHDDNGDDLSFDLYLRGDGEHVWRVLKKGLTERVYSFDASSLPDGGYQIKVVASDAPSHTPGEALTDEQASDRFELDTTAPAISALKAAESKATAASGKNAGPASESIAVSFDAKDAASPVSHAEYSIDAGPWQYVDPVGGLSDAKDEHYAFTVPVPVAAQGEPEHLVTVRVYDRHDNMATAKVVVATGSAK
jgi:WD40 repeat protein